VQKEHECGEGASDEWPVLYPDRGAEDLRREGLKVWTGGRRPQRQRRQLVPQSKLEEATLPPARARTRMDTTFKGGKARSRKRVSAEMHHP